MRGLAYYTGVVFEAFDAGRTLRAICGGGRYDGLLAALGGSPLPAVGFGFGDVVIQELLADLGLLPELPRRIDAVVLRAGARRSARPPSGSRRRCGRKAPASSSCSGSRA